MEVSLSKEFLEICAEIQRRGLSEDQWALLESCDMFQSKNYCGGFDATEMEFTFSYFEPGKEWWFQFPLVRVEEVLSGVVTKFEARSAE